MYYVRNKNGEEIVEFELENLYGSCNMTTRKLIELHQPEKENEEVIDEEYADVLQKILDFSKPFKGETETDNYICLLAFPNIKITTDIKLKQEVEPDA